MITKVAITQGGTMESRLSEGELLKRIAQNKLLNEALWTAAKQSQPAEVTKQIY